jgi:putative peptidoglycan lipid II flippase
MASHIVESGEEDLWRTTVIGLRFTLLLTIPASLFTMFLREPIVSVLFKAGLFSASAVENTSQWVLFMGLSILPMGIDTLMLRCYVMRGKLSVYGLLFLIRIGLHYALSHALMDRLGPAYGLGSALTIAAIIHAVLLLIVLRMECPIRIGHLGLSDLLRIGSCGITSSLAGYAFHFFLGILTQPSHWIGSAFLLALAGVVSGAVFVLTLRFLGPLEFDRLSEVLSSVRSRQTRRPQSDT